VAEKLRGAKEGSADLKALVVQARSQSGDVLSVSRLDHAMDGYRIDIFIREGAIVGDINDTGALLGNQAREPSQPAGAVTDGRREPAEPSV
jgi:hypothetical protein